MKGDDQGSRAHSEQGGEEMVAGRAGLARVCAGREMQARPFRCGIGGNEILLPSRQQVAVPRWLLRLVSRAQGCRKRS